MNHESKPMAGKKVLMISTDRKIFEVGSAVRARQVAYAADWDEVHIIVFTGRRMPDGKPYTETALSANVFVYPTRSWSRLLYPFGAMRQGRFIIPRRGITHITCQDSSLTAMAGVVLKKEFALPLELQIHEDLGSPHYGYTPTNRLRAWMARTYLPRADHIRVVSNKIQQFLIQQLKIPAQNIMVKPIAVDTDWIRSAPVLPAGDLRKKFPQFTKIALSVGRLEREKNVALILEAWPAVLGVLQGAGLVIVGSGSEEAHLRRLADKLGITKSVAFVGWADQATIASHYKTADVLVSTSLFEGYGLIFKEAAAAGVPIVSTDVGIARDMGAHIVDWSASAVAHGIREVFGV